MKVTCWENDQSFKGLPLLDRIWQIRPKSEMFVQETKLSTNSSLNRYIDTFVDISTPLATLYNRGGKYTVAALQRGPQWILHRLDTVVSSSLDYILTVSHFAEIPSWYRMAQGYTWALRRPFPRYSRRPMWESLQTCRHHQKAGKWRRTTRGIFFYITPYYLRTGQKHKISKRSHLVKHGEVESGVANSLTSKKRVFSSTGLKRSTIMFQLMKTRSGCSVSGRSKKSIKIVTRGKRSKTFGCSSLMPQLGVAWTRYRRGSSVSTGSLGRGSD